MDESPVSTSLRNSTSPSLQSIETSSSSYSPSNPHSHSHLHSHSHSYSHSHFLPRTTNAQPSIITAEPQGDLFPIHPFGINFNHIIQEQQDNDQYYEYFSDPEQEQEVADRCDTTIDLEEANQFFSDPTVHGLLKEWNDEKIIPSKTHGDNYRKNHHDPALRPTWSSAFGQAADMTEYGDPSNLHLKETIRFYSTHDDSLRRLLSSPSRGHKRIRLGRQKRNPRLSTKNLRVLTSKKKATAENTHNDPSQSDQVDDRSNHHGRSKGSYSVQVSSSVALSSKSSTLSTSPNTTTIATVPESSTNSQSTTINNVQQIDKGGKTNENTESTGAETLSNTPNLRKDPDEALRELHDQEDFELVHKSAEERSAHESRFVKTTLENNFQKFSLMMEDSKLKTLSDESRFEVPVKLRPPVNYRAPQPPIEQMQPLQESDVIISVAIYSPVRPSQRTEEYLFLGSQTLTALRDAFYCLHDFTTRGPDELPLGAPTRNTEKRKVSNSFLFIEGVFYSDSPLIRAKIDKRDELREAERVRLSNLAERRNQLRQEAIEKREQIRRGKMVASATPSRPPANNGSTSTRTQETSENDLIDEDIEAEDSDLRKQMENSTYRDLPIEEIELENEEEYSRVSLDYSQVILDWVDSDPKRKESSGFRNLQRKYMHDVLIQDLSIRINHPYLFVHQGNCEHIIMFRDLRLFNSEHDEKNRLCYPIPIFNSKRSRHKCRMCNINQAFYVTVGDRLAGETPCYFCKPCYAAFHYDENGNILYDDFRVFEYSAFQAQQSEV